MHLDRIPLLVMALLAELLTLSACGEGQPKALATSVPSAPQVTVAKPVKRLVSGHDEYVGRFVAVDYVEVRARVSGYLEAVRFADGQLVKAGDPLFTIDRRTFQASLDQAESAVAQAKANRDFAESDLKRGESLVRDTTITQQTLDQRTQALRVAEAAVAAQEAAARQAELDLEFTELLAPVSGRIGDRRVSPGNLVTGGANGNTTLLATIASIDPIRFEFSMDETSYLQYVRATSQNASIAANRGITLPVKLKLIDEEDFTHVGHMDFVDNAIDRSSGTIRGRAEFPNPDGKLTPGMFGRIQVSAKAPEEALLVPDTAIGSEQVKKFVLSVNADHVATQKYVTLGPVVDGLRVVVAGLSEDDVIIVNGLMRVRPGSKVAPQQVPMASTGPQDVTTRAN
jgi:RND family efflux transporter MFP subunit